MKHTANTTDFKKLYTLITAMVFLCIFSGILVSVREAGGFLAEGVKIVRNISFKETGFSDTLSKGICGHLFYCVAVLLLCTGFPGMILPGIFIGFKLFFLGITVGLAAKSCVSGKAVAICFAVFVSNILILPLYIALFLAALSFSAKACFGIFPSGSVAKQYFSFCTKVLILFVLMCLAECVQSALGVFVLKTAIKVRY